MSKQPEISLQEAIKRCAMRIYGNQAAAARAWGVSKSMVTLVVQGKRSPNNPMIRDASTEYPEGA